MYIKSAEPTDWSQIATDALTDERAFTALYEHFFPRVYQYLLSKTHEPSLSDEIISATFFKMYEHLKEFDPAKGAFSTWLFTIARNELNIHYRRVQYRETEELTEEIPLAASAWDMPEERTLAKERSDELRAAIEKLPEQSRRIVEMTYWLGMKGEVIAQVLNMQPTAVRVTLKRARDTLKKFLS